MSIRFAVLALLAEEPLHGYAIHAVLEERLLHLCEPAYGDVYRVLGTLGRDGLVAAAEERVGRRPRRRIYRATPAGLAELRAWLLAPPSRGARSRDDLALRVLLATWCAPELESRVVAVHCEHARAELRELLAQRTPERPAADVATLLRALHLEQAIGHARVRAESAELHARVLDRYRRGTRASELVREVAAHTTRQ